MNRRMDTRIALTDMVADISDGRGFFKGVIHDFSRFGMALDDISPKMNSQAQQLTVVVDGQGKHFKMKISPRWESVADGQKIVGCQIEQGPFTWTEFVMRFEPEEDDL